MVDEKILSLDKQLRTEGWTPIGAIREGGLADYLSDLSLDIARGKYADCFIIPLEFLFKGTGYKPMRETHAVYAKLSKTHEEDMKKRNSFYFVQILCEQGPIQV